VPTLKTNRYVDELLNRVFRLRVNEAYITNAFPFIKPGGMSAAIPMRDVVRAVELFTVPELELARPTRVLALGSQVHRALTRAGAEADSNLSSKRRSVLPVWLSVVVPGPRRTCPRSAPSLYAKIGPTMRPISMAALKRVAFQPIA